MSSQNNYTVEIFSEDKAARCNGRLYYNCEKTGHWKAVVGYSIPEEITAICKKIMENRFRHEMDAEVLVIQLLRELNISRMYNHA
jgi:hypothetical protein